MNDCSQHKKDLFGQTDMKEVAEAIGDLNYEALCRLLTELSIKIYRDAYKDAEGDREQLAHYLCEAQYQINSASGYIYKAWQISKKFMNQQTPKPEQINSKK